MPSDKQDFFRKFGLLPPWKKPLPPVEKRLIPFRCAINGAHCVMEVERIPGQEHFAVVGVQESLGGSMRRSGEPPSSTAIDCDVIDFTDFYCPSCRRLGIKAKVTHIFSKCGKCWSIVCNGSSSLETNARGRKVSVFHCYAECGASTTSFEGARAAKLTADSLIAPAPGGLSQLPDNAINVMRLTFDKGI